MNKYCDPAARKPVVLHEKAVKFGVVPVIVQGQVGGKTLPFNAVIVGAADMVTLAGMVSATMVSADVGAPPRFCTVIR